MFEIMNIVSRKPFKIYQLKPKKKIQDLKELFMKTNQNFLLEMRFTWENLNTWQKYTFSKPVFKEIPNSLFEWTQKGYHVSRKRRFLNRMFSDFKRERGEGFIISADEINKPSSTSWTARASRG